MYILISDLDDPGETGETGESLMHEVGWVTNNHGINIIMQYTIMSLGIGKMEAIYYNNTEKFKVHVIKKTKTRDRNIQIAHRNKQSE